MKRLFVKDLYWLPTTLGMVMVVVTSIHRSPIHVNNSGSYITHPLVLMEMLLMVTICLLLAIWFCLAIIALFKRKKRDLAILLINIFIGFILMVTGMIIDAPALLYMT